jgi:hypothetical protein
LLCLITTIVLQFPLQHHTIMDKEFIVGFQAYVEDQGDDLGLSGMKRSVYGPPGLVLGGFRAASKVYSHIHEDPEEVNLECPFAIDNDEAEDYRSRYFQALKMVIF